MESPSTQPSVTALKIFLDYSAGTSALASGTYKYYGNATSNRITAGTLYDVRVYADNDASINGSRSRRYIYFANVATLNSGVPGAPTGLSVGTLTTTTATASWTAPTTRDITSNTATTYFQQYKVNLVANASVRYGNVLTSHTTPQMTSNVTGSDGTTSLGLTTLNPGTTYYANVAARNALNTSFGNASSPSVSFTTSYPTAPSYASTTLSLSNQASLIYGSGASGYSLDGTTSKSPILNYNTITGTSPLTSSVSNFRLNANIADTSPIIGNVVAFAGPSGSESVATVNTVGFGTSFTSPQTITSNAVSLTISSEGDVYSSPSSGFYKQATAYATAASISTYFTAGNTLYNMYLKITPVGGSLVTTSTVSFYVDALNALPSVVQAAITSASTTYANITGVPTFTSSTTFYFQTTISNLAYYYLRSDKTHFTAEIQNSSASSLSSTLTVTKTTMDGSTHSYYTAPATSYATSVTKHNTNGNVLSVNPGNIQFNTFSITLTSASSIYNEALQIKVSPFNLYGSGSSSTVSGRVSTSTGSSSAIRIDTASVTALSSLSGTLMAPGSGQYPSSGYTTAYDHNTSIASTEQLQLLNGKWYSKSAAGYSNYSSYYFPGSVTGPDYSSISSSGYRYVCLQFSSLSSSTYDSVQVGFSYSGLTLDTSSDTANFRLYMKVVGTTTTNWVSGTAAINANGYDAITSDGLGALSTNSSYTSFSSGTASLKIFVPTGTIASAVIYIRLGLNQATSCYVSGITCTAN
jgi:hypothetical protein